MKQGQVISLLVLCAFIRFAEALSKVDQQKCVNDLVEWCKKQDYTNVGKSTFSITGIDNGKKVNIYCETGTTGTSCIRNFNIVWFTCDSSHLPLYNFQLLRENSLAGADNEICSAASIIAVPTATENTQMCVNDLVDWCDKQLYTPNANSEWSISELVNGQTVSIKCTTDTSETKCTKDGFSGNWFSCSAVAATYKGVILSKSSANGEDDEICYAASRINMIPTLAVESQKCVNDLVSWCIEQNLSNGVTTSFESYETIGGQRVKVACNTITGRTDCTRTGYTGSVFTCVENTVNVATYKTVVLTENVRNGADVDICYVALKITS